MHKAPRIPAYRLHKASGRARVILSGRHVYLGEYGSEESKTKYERVVAEWLASKQCPAASPSTPTLGGKQPIAGLTISGLILAYWRFSEGYYVHDGAPTGELANICFALKPLRRLFGGSRADDFGPKGLKAVRQAMIEAGLSRGVINQRINIIRRMIRWAVAEELVTPTAYYALQAVTGLRYGRSEARETEPVKPVPDLHVALVLPFVAPQVADMICLQRLTGMRAGEIVIMRPADIDTTLDVWQYEPSHHKNRWRGHGKSIPLGPEAQRILAPYLNRAADIYLFSPLEAEAWRMDHRPPYHGRKRKTKIYPAELRRREALRQKRQSSCRQPSRPKRDRYSTASYRRAIERGIAKAGKAGIVVPHWHPHQLRHSRATEVRRQYGVEGAQVLLGHKRACVTEIYAQPNADLASQIAAATG